MGFDRPAKSFRGWFAWHRVNLEMQNRYGLEILIPRISFAMSVPEKAPGNGR
jgi:hypothetical protein